MQRQIETTQISSRVITVNKLWNRKESPEKFTNTKLRSVKSSPSNCYIIVLISISLEQLESGFA